MFEINLYEEETCTIDNIGKRVKLTKVSLLSLKMISMCCSKAY